MGKDMRCPEAIARDDYANANPTIYDPTTLKVPESRRQYLKNRLDSAFIEGIKVGKRLAKAQLIELLNTTIGE